MSALVGGIFTKSDQLQMQALEQRLTRNNVISANIANAETPGYRALGYDFESQLQEVAGNGDDLPMRTSAPQHFRGEFTQEDGTILPDVYVRPTESVGQDGNTVDIDDEMARMAQNQILYRSTIETINRKTAILKYAITNGGR